MSNALRLTVLFLAIAAAGISAYDISQPYKFGMFGYDNVYRNNGDQVVTRIYPDSPVEHAGLKPGDVVLWSTVSPRVAFDSNYRRANQTIRFPVMRGGKISQMQIVTATYKYLKPVEEGPLGLLVLLVSVGTGVLIALRGSAQRPEVRILALFFAIYGLGMAFVWFGDVAQTPVLAFAGSICAIVATLCVYYLLLLFIAHFPPNRSRLRAAIGRAALPLVLVGLLIQTWNVIVAAVFPSMTLVQIGGNTAAGWLVNLVQTIVSLALIAGVVDGLIRTDEEHRVQMRWVGVAILLSASASLVTEISLFTNPNPPPWAPWISLFQDVPLLAIAYAILRHRLVDLSIVISRAAIFGFVSVVLVTLFLALEWAAAQIFERTVGDAAANGLPGQALRLAIALAVGLSARPIHSFFERYLNKVFFGKRAQALAAMRRFALEADVITDTPSLLDLTFDCLRENTEARYAAIYTGQGSGYQLERSSNDSLPEVLPQNDAAVVRLRRWNEPFEMDLSKHQLSEALLLPMTVRGVLLGILICGPKRERTHYLSDEVDALALIAHRVGTAYEQLSREAAFDSAAEVESLRALIRAEMHSLGLGTQPA